MISKFADFSKSPADFTYSAAEFAKLAILKKLSTISANQPIAGYAHSAKTLPITRNQQFRKVDTTYTYVSIFKRESTLLLLLLLLLMIMIILITRDG